MRNNESNHNHFLLYTNANGDVRVDVWIQDETIWLTINQIAELFGVDKSGISRHIRNIFDTGELERSATVAKFTTVQREGARKVIRELEYYNLDVVISVGYGQEILTNAGSISKQIADKLAEDRYEQFRLNRLNSDDLDEQIRRLT